MQYTHPHTNKHIYHAMDAKPHTYPHTKCVNVILIRGVFYLVIKM